jgi:hypothetical protein
MPFVGGRVPVQLPQRPPVEVKNHGGDRLSDREAGGIDPPFSATLEHGVRGLLEEFMLVRLRR